MKNWKKVMIAITLIGLVTLGIIVYANATKTEESNYKFVHCPGDPNLMVMVDKDSTGYWIPADEFENPVKVDWSTTWDDGERSGLYSGWTEDGEHLYMSKAYWNSRILSCQPAVYFGYIWIEN